MADIVVHGETYNDSNPDTWTGVVINKSTSNNLTFTDNTITSVSASGYMLFAGDEGIETTNNNLDGSVIEGNKVTWNGTDMTSINHGLFTGCNINASIKYNYLTGVPLGIIRKSASSMIDTAGGVAYNIINKGMVGVVVKGISDVKIYNNTLYSDRTFADTNSGRALVDVYTNTDISPNSEAHGTKIKNNIFYSVNQINNIRVVDTDALTDFESDYNLFYCEAGTPMFEVDGVRKTFAQWQALGYDLNSIVVDPGFIDFIDFIPSGRLNYGTDLGSTFLLGLSTSAIWETSLDPDTALQNGTWQVGARVYEEVIPPEEANYYLSPSGDDNGVGTITDPWFTLEKLHSELTAGQIGYMRGGAYEYDNPQLLEGKNGSAGSLIKIWAYPGEIPVVTKSSVWTYSTHIAGIYFTGEYFHFKGIEVQGFTQTDDNEYPGFDCGDGTNHNIFERLNIHHNGAANRLINQDCDDNLILNCDFHHNYDPYTSGDAYGNADGLGCNPKAGTTNTIRGCRAWANSDDGFDIYGAAGLVLIDKCWAWENGYREDGVTKGGNGCGFKLGNALADYSTTHLRTVTNCLSFHNRSAGFTQNEGLCISWLFNNTAYHNADGAEVYNLGFEFEETSIVHVLRNNIAHANQHPANLQANYGNCTEDHNSWDTGYSVSDADFVSINSAAATGARQSNGNLPVMSFLHLKINSPLRDSGLAVAGLISDGDGNAYNDPPSLGAFEHGTTPAEDVLITAITVTGASGATTITTPAGTLQMFVHIDPFNATNQNITWTTQNITGSGWCGQDGIFHAVADGTVLVIASAQDGGGGIGQLELTLSNQTASSLLSKIKSCWEFNETSGDAIDAMGIQNLTPYNVVQNQTGKLNKSYQYDGANSYVGEVDTVYELSVISLCRWFKTSLIDTYQDLISNYWYGTDEQGYDLFIDSQNRVGWACHNSKTVKSGIFSTTLVCDDNWHLAIATFDGTYQKLYIDGVLEATSTAWNYPITYHANSRFQIGVVIGSDYFEGLGDQTIVGDGLFTQDDVDALWNNGDGVEYPFIPIIEVTNITVTGAGSATTISTDNGTLQMSAHIDPHDATNPVVTWSVFAGTGLATINGTGLLSAISDGTVTVRATSTDGSGIYGELVITISNQTVVYKNLAPSGWHVPDNIEIGTLMNYLGGTTVAGGKMKETGLTHWTPNVGATNSSGFTALGSGYRDYGAILGFFSLREYAGWWSSTIYNSTAGNHYYVEGASDNFGHMTAFYKNSGLSIRCIKDSTILTHGQMSTVTDVDGNVYPTICIGTQEWMAANLKVTRFNDGTPIDLVTGNAAWAARTTAAYCWYKNIAE
jgi:uncharacterized protein (TIGR02145 family)